MAAAIVSADPVNILSGRLFPVLATTAVLIRGITSCGFNSGVAVAPPAALEDTAIVGRGNASPIVRPTVLRRRVFDHYPGSSDRYSPAIAKAIAKYRKSAHRRINGQRKYATF